MSEYNIAILGAGNMGRSIAKGLVASGFVADKLWLASPNIKPDAKHKGVHVTRDNAEAVSQCDIVILATKPAKFSEVSAQIKKALNKKQPLVISVAAATPAAYLCRMFGDDLCYVRAMPNTPTFCQAGVTGLYAEANVGASEREMAEKIFRTLGLTVWLDDENLMPVLTALTGSGPAYFFLFMQYMKEQAIHMGLPSNMADLLTRQTAFGAAKMSLESDEELSQLREDVSSPGGVTESAVKRDRKSVV